MCPAAQWIDLPARTQKTLVHKVWWRSAAPQSGTENEPIRFDFSPGGRRLEGDLVADKPKKDQQIRDVIKEEKGRRRPAQDTAAREAKQWEAEAERLLKRGTEEEMIEAIRRAGIDPDSPAGRHALRVWRENQY